MKIFVKVKPNSKKESFEKIEPSKKQRGEKHFQASVKEPPIKGKANTAVIKLVAEYFKTSSSKIKIIAGRKSKQKVIEIN